MLKLLTPNAGAEVSLQTAIQKKFIAEEDKRRAMDGALTFRWYALEKEGCDRSLPEPVRFSWEDIPDEGGDPRCAGGQYLLIVSEYADLRAPVVEMTETCEYDLYNLDIGKEYFWCVQKEGKRSEISSFRTAWDLPRCLYIDGVSNVRDAGGYRIPGGRVRRGMVYRGGEVERHMHITPKGIEQMKALGIRTDLDLRGEAVGVIEYPLLPLYGIDRVLLPIVPYAEIFEKKHRVALRKILKVFTKPKAYPIYHHCWGGADRGGTLAFLLGALVGMSLDDLYYEYEFTSLSIWGLRSRNYEPFRRMVEKLNGFPGDTLAEKTAAFFLSLGLSEKDVTAIRTLLTEKDI